MMDISGILSTIGVLASSVSALVEWFKAVLAASSLNDSLSEEARVLVIRTFAILAGIAISFLADFDLVHVVFPTAPIAHEVGLLATGLALMLPADGLKSILEFIKAGRDQMDARATSKVTIQTETTPAASGTQAATNVNVASTSSVSSDPALG